MLHLPRHAAPSWMDTWRKNEVSWVPAKALNFRPNSPTPPTQIPRSLTHMVWAWANHIRNEKKLQNTLKNTKMRTATDWPAAPVGSFVRKGSARLRMLSSAVGAICRRVRELWPLLHLPRVTFDPGLPYIMPDSIMIWLWLFGPKSVCEKISANPRLPSDSPWNCLSEYTQLYAN